MRRSWAISDDVFEEDEPSTVVLLHHSDGMLGIHNPGPGTISQVTVGVEAGSTTAIRLADIQAFTVEEMHDMNFGQEVIESNEPAQRITLGVVWTDDSGQQHHTTFPVMVPRMRSV
jgi:hypothetical protein